MDERLAVCRVCLATNVQNVVEDLQLQELYERLTRIPTTDIRPVALCYICHGQLKASHRFMLKCLKAEEILTAILNQDTDGSEVLKPVDIDRSALEDLSYKIVPVIYDNADQSVDIKEELLNIYDTNVEFKEEEIKDLLEIANSIDFELDDEKLQLDAKDDIPLNTHMNMETVREEEKARGRKKKRKRSKKATPIAKRPKRKLEKTNKNIKNETINLDNNNNGQINSVADTKVCKPTKFTCAKCKKTFKEQCYLIAHTCKHTYPYVCDVCNKTFTAMKKFTKHTRLHSEGNNMCNVCNKSFTTKASLSTHTRIHTGEKPYVCDVCDKKFNERGRLAKHMRVHTGEKPYDCDVCNKCFRTKSVLNIHSRSHTGEKPYVCTVCDKRFVVWGHVVRHARTHTGEKPYGCNICNKSFIQNSSLKRHMVCMHLKQSHE